MHSVNAIVAVAVVFDDGDEVVGRIVVVEIIRGSSRCSTQLLLMSCKLCFCPYCHCGDVVGLCDRWSIRKHDETHHG